MTRRFSQSKKNVYKCPPSSSSSPSIMYSKNSIRRALRLNYIKLSATISSFQQLRKLALLVVAICIITSISAIFGSSDYAHVEYLYNYYDTNSYVNNNHNANYGNFLTNNDVVESDPLRQRALQNAKHLTREWIKAENQDEVEMEGIISTFKSQLKKIEQDELEEKRQREAEQEEIEAESAYYLYYQDDNDSTSTVIGLPSQNQSSDPIIFRRFVGSLRKTGFGGTIIIGVEPTVGEELVEYLKAMRVIIKYLTPVECTFEFAKKNQKCYHPYSHIKREWSYFPLARDWLTSCDACIGSAVIASVRDTVFQLNPFGKGMPIISRLHLYEQHPTIVASHTSAGVLLKACDNIDLDKINTDLQFYPEMSLSDPMRISTLSAGTAVGTRDDVIDYLGAVHSVMREWMQRSQCHFEHSTSDDGMAIVNYLRLKRRLPYRTRIIPHRTGIVNNVGYEGRNAYQAHVHFWEFKGLTSEEASKKAYEGAVGEGWIDTDYMLTDADGQFIDVFFQKSAIIYEYNAFGTPFTDWFDKRLGSFLTVGVDGTAPSSTNDGGDVSGNNDLTDGAGSGAIDNGGGSTVSTNTTDVDKGIGTDENGNGDTTSTTAVNEEGDDYYIKKDDENEESSNSTSTSPLNTRKVDNENDNSVTKTKLEVKKEDQQPMYYREEDDENDRESDIDYLGDDGDGNGDEDQGINGEDRSAQVVPVEEIKAKDEEEDEEGIKEERLAVKKGAGTGTSTITSA